MEMPFLNLRKTPPWKGFQGVDFTINCGENSSVENMR